MAHDPWGTPVWLKHRDGPVFTVQTWTGPDGTKKLRILRPWWMHKVEVVDAMPATWRQIALECAEHQPFRGKKLAQFLAWRARMLDPPADAS